MPNAAKIDWKQSLSKPAQLRDSVVAVQVTNVFSGEEKADESYVNAVAGSTVRVALLVSGDSRAGLGWTTVTGRDIKTKE